MHAVAAAAPPFRADRMQATDAHNAVSRADLELLDALSSMPSSFPHQSSYAPSATKPRPLSTLNALRRPPIDPMVLAASLSSGPHVTRHHFHHSFGSHAHASKSQQMPASQRKAVQAATAASPPPSAASSSAAPPSQPRSRRPSAASGSYANCDFDDFEDSTPSNVASSSSIKVEPVPEVTDEERAYYASRQAPRSVRLQRQKEIEQVRAQAQSDASRQAAHDAAKGRAVAQAVGVRASDEPAQPHLLDQPGNQAGLSVLVPPSEPALKIAQALDERKASVAVAAAAPSHIPVTPAAQTLGAVPAQVATPLGKPSISSIVRPPPVRVRCYARTRVPTPHGEIFCHLYKNNHDAKEHLAIVIDPYQNDERSTEMGPDGRPIKESDPIYQQQALRSKTLDEVWGPEETDMERIVRGAYVGRLGPSFQVASKPLPRHLQPQHAHPKSDDSLAPLVRIHSECFTGETIGSQRCDCGEQLDEAIRLISEAYDSSRPSTRNHSSQQPQKLGRGVIVYLRQEGRGIGLLDKLMAYNLQDMGHDTVSANILLGHLPDARKYDIASAILRDLGVDECRLLTNNPEKMEALEAEGVRVTERVGMVPRVWKFGKSLRRKRAKKSGASRGGKAEMGVAGSGSRGSRSLDSTRKSANVKKTSSLLRQMQLGGMESSVISQASSTATPDSDDSDAELDPTTAGLRHQGEDMLSAQDTLASDNDTDSESVHSDDSYLDHVLRRSGTTMIGASITRGPELDKYLRTKVERMRHILTPPSQDFPPDSPLSQNNSDVEPQTSA